MKGIVGDANETGPDQHSTLRGAAEQSIHAAAAMREAHPRLTPASLQLPSFATVLPSGEFRRRSSSEFLRERAFRRLH
jgi:hypothetical protein